MLRVGLTGGLGSGKSTVATMLRVLGAHVVYADAMARAMMEPGEAVYGALVEHFGPEIVQEDGHLDRAILARIAFGEGRVEELNSIVHPAVIARQARRAAETAVEDPAAVFVVESALIFETRHGGEHGWQDRFDRVLLVVASEKLKIERFVARSLAGTEPTEDERERAAEEARRRLLQQGNDLRKASAADFVIENEGSIEALQAQIALLWPVLVAEAKVRRTPERT